jgi:hypothetical protein
MSVPELRTPALIIDSRVDDGQTGIWPTPVRVVAMSSLTILELAVGASGPTTGTSFSILKA